MSEFKKLQTVYWQSRPGCKVHVGVIVEIVPAWGYPQSKIKDGGVSPRPEVSYVVRVCNPQSERFYWPRKQWLALSEEAARNVKRYRPWVDPSLRKKPWQKLAETIRNSDV